MPRESIEIEGLSHLGPIPVATRLGPLIESSIIRPFDAGGRRVPDSLDDQVDNLFIHMGNILAAVGAAWDDVVKVTFFVADPVDAKKALNRPWVEKFPDPASRPARHTTQNTGGGKFQGSCVFTAYVEDRDEMMNATQRLIDEREICGLAVRYCWALDDRDWAGLADVFVPDATACFGTNAQRNGLAEITQVCRRGLSRLDSSHHMVTNHQVVIDGDTAVHRCYMQAQHVRTGTDGGHQFILAGRYIDQVVRTDKGWRIQHRDLIIMWTQGNPAVTRSPRS